MYVTTDQSVYIVTKIKKIKMVCQLENYFEDILSPYISGFRKTHSCETVLIRMVQHIRNHLIMEKLYAQY